MSGGCADELVDGPRSACRPCGEAMVMPGGARPSCSAASAMPASGARRFRSTSYVSALSGLTTDERRGPLPGRSRSSSFDPRPALGAASRAGRGTTETRQGSCRPGRGMDQGVASGRDSCPATAWAGVGASNERSNHARTAGLNGASGSSIGPGTLVGEGGDAVPVTGGRRIRQTGRFDADVRIRPSLPDVSQATRVLTGRDVGRAPNETRRVSRGWLASNVQRGEHGSRRSTKGDGSGRI